MTLPIRPAEPDEFGALARVVEYAFGEPPDEESAQHERELLEFDRTLAAFDGDTIVACAAAYSLDMTVPGGAVPAAGVTWVGVLPTHRRRGLLTALMRRQLDDVRARGTEPIAALWASESAIYGRFGYGVASLAVSLTVPRSSNQLRPGVDRDDGLCLRIVEPADAIALVLPVYEHDRARRPGMFALSQKLQELRNFVPERAREGASPLRVVLAEDDHGVRAYARYLTKATWSPGGPTATVIVRELHGRDPAALAAVWAYLLDIDLSAQTETRLRPPDEPLLGMLVDFRRAQPTLSDALYVRIMDVGAALAARTYATPVDVVVEVRDGFCPWNVGRWRLVGDATGARCERTEDTADIGLDVRELGATYLGGTSLQGLADAGLVTERSAGAVRELSAALRHEPAPWCPIVF